MFPKIVTKTVYTAKTKNKLTFVEKLFQNFVHVS